MVELGVAHCWKETHGLHKHKICFVENYAVRCGCVIRVVRYVPTRQRQRERAAPSTWQDCDCPSSATVKAEGKVRASKRHSVCRTRVRKFYRHTFRQPKLNESVRDEKQQRGGRREENRYRI